jgi:TRAP-type C4-dicarboxylate transport system substrate-binding protein
MTISRILAAACLALVVADASAATLKIATVSPEGSTWIKLLREGGDAVAAETGGRVKFKFYPGGVMGDDRAVLRKMRAGQLHGAVLTAGGLTQQYSDIQLYNLPMVFDSLAEVDFVRARLDPLLMRGLESAGYVSFGLAEVGFAYAMSKQPLASVADVRAAKVWVPDGDEGSARALRAFGVAPIPLSIADVLGGLQTGLIDSVAVPPVGAIALQWHTQLRHVTDLPLLYVYGLLVVANKPFAGLDVPDQAVVRRVMAGVVANVNTDSRRGHEQALEALTRQGLDLVEVKPGQEAEWRAQADAAAREMVAGGFVTQDLYQSLREALDDFRDGP